MFYRSFNMEGVVPSLRARHLERAAHGEGERCRDDGIADGPRAGLITHAVRGVRLEQPRESCFRSREGRRITSIGNGT